MISMRSLSFLRDIEQILHLILAKRPRKVYLLHRPKKGGSKTLNFTPTTILWARMMMVFENITPSYFFNDVCSFRPHKYYFLSWLACYICPRCIIYILCGFVHEYPMTGNNCVNVNSVFCITSLYLNTRSLFLLITTQSHAKPIRNEDGIVNDARHSYEHFTSSLQTCAKCTINIVSSLHEICADYTEAWECM